MSKIVKIIVGVVLTIAVIWIALASVSKVPGPFAGAGKVTIKIGATLPLTGDIAVLGESNKNAILLAKENLKNTKYNYEFVFEDDGFNPKTAAGTANKLITIDKVSALISFGSPVGNVVSPIAENSRIVHISDFASDTNVANGAYNFLHYTPPYKDSALMVSELQKRKISKIVFFAQQDNPGAAALINAFRNDIGNSGIKVLADQKFNTGTKDFRSQIAKVKNLGAEIYVLEATTPELEILTKQLREAGIKTPVTTMEAFEFSDQLNLFEGAWYVNGADMSKEFIKMYTDKYGKTPKFGAGNGYDAVNLLVNAIEAVGDGKTVPSQAAIKDALSSVKSFDGVMGKGMSIDPNGIVVSNAVVRMIKNGAPQTIAPQD